MATRLGRTEEAERALRDLAANQILDHTRYVLRTAPPLTPSQVRAIIAALHGQGAGS